MLTVSTGIPMNFRWNWRWFSVCDVRISCVFIEKTWKFFEKIVSKLRNGFDKNKTLSFTRISKLKFVCCQLEHPDAFENDHNSNLQTKKKNHFFIWLIYLKKKFSRFVISNCFFFISMIRQRNKPPRQSKKIHSRVQFLWKKRRIVSCLLLVEKPRWKSRKIK